MTVRTCRECGERFEAQQPWHQHCRRCWRSLCEDKAREAAYAEGLRDGMAAAERHPAPAPRPQLDPVLLGSAIQLTHPDRHPVEREALANRVTAALLAMRRVAA